MKFVSRPAASSTSPSYRHAIGVVTTAMEIIVDAAGYPTEMISKNSHDYRPLGLGYANLGALLMDFGLPYDSDAGRRLRGYTYCDSLRRSVCTSPRVIAETCPPLGAATPLICQSDRLVKTAVLAPASTSTVSRSSTSSACTARRSTTSIAH